ncbi:MAG: hypothetical protein WCY28_02255 [Candidatus Shapirobacteria bacterium]
MNNNKGQSIIDMIFSVGIMVLVLTGVIILIVSTAKLKRISLERQKAIDLSQLLIEKKTLEIKENKKTFWDNATSLTNEVGVIEPNFPEYNYDIDYDGGCNALNCKIIFTVNWGNNQKLSVEKFFSKGGI